VVRDEIGELGRLTWRAGDDGKAHAVTGAVIRLPRPGALHVQRLLIDSTGRVKDLGGYVQPD
jgi:hypothetical protein